MSRISYIDDNTICAFGEEADLFKVREFIVHHALKFGFNDNSANQISLAVDEACSNLIKHAYKFDKNKKFCININLENQEIVIKITDESNPFNPNDLESPNMDEYFKQFKKGGLGILIMKKVMDSINYFPSSMNTQFNILELRKQLR